MFSIGVFLFMVGLWFSCVEYQRMEFHGLRYSGSLLQKIASRVSVRMPFGFDIILSV